MGSGPKDRRQSADDASLDADMILAAQAGALVRVGDETVIAAAAVPGFNPQLARFSTVLNAEDLPTRTQGKRWHGFAVNHILDALAVPLGVI